MSVGEEIVMAANSKVMEEVTRMCDRNKIVVAMAGLVDMTEMYQSALMLVREDGLEMRDEREQWEIVDEMIEAIIESATDRLYAMVAPIVQEEIYGWVKERSVVRDDIKETVKRVVKQVMNNER
jgi:predicted GTPase